MKRVIRQRFDAISLCFCDWISAEYIVRRAERCRFTAIAVFANACKIGAILDVCGYVCQESFETLSPGIRSDPVREVRVASYHLAKNLEIDVGKPDRHLARLAARLGFRSAESMCNSIGREVGEPAAVVDIVLWRYCALSRGAASNPGACAAVLSPLKSL